MNISEYCLNRYKDYELGKIITSKRRRLIIRTKTNVETCTPKIDII